MPPKIADIAIPRVLRSIFLGTIDATAGGTPPGEVGTARTFFGLSDIRFKNGIQDRYNFGGYGTNRAQNRLKRTSGSRLRAFPDLYKSSEPRRASRVPHFAGRTATNPTRQFRSRFQV